jgi:hypothetical protein
MKTIFAKEYGTLQYEGDYFSRVAALSRSYPETDYAFPFNISSKDTCEWDCLR